MMHKTSTSQATSSEVAVDDIASFTHVTDALLNLGAVTALQYLSLPIPAPTAFPTALQQSYPVPPLEGDVAAKGPTARLHRACQHTFGNTSALTFSYEDVPEQGKRCHLTITRPNGDTRTYVSPTFHFKKQDAKASVSAQAIQSGALDFILSGESGTTPTPSASTPVPEAANTPLDMDESGKTIEQCCLEWTGGKIKPFWLNINEPKLGRTFGCALRIRIGSNNSRVYSVNTVYNSPGEAKKACADVAIAEGAVDYIKTWQATAVDQPPDESEPSAPTTLQQFFESLPQPFPEPVTAKTAADINGPAWLNTTIQSARGGKLVPNFIYTVNPQLGLHGCLLRLERPGEVKSYLVDAQFRKRPEAKSAVCLLAMSQGVGAYIRGVGKAVEDKLPPATRKHVSEVLLPQLTAEYRKVHGPGVQPVFDYDMDLDACGATLTVELAPNANAERVRKYTVPAEYRNRNDAKLAVVLHAVEQGVIEYLRFFGKPPPPGYVANYNRPDSQFFNAKKRKNWDSGGGNGGFGDRPIRGGYNHGFAGDSGGNWPNKKPRVGNPPIGLQQGPPGNFSRPPAPGGGYGPHGQYGPGGGYQNGGGFQQHNGSFQNGGAGGKPGWNGQQKKPYTPKPHGPGPGQFGGAPAPFQPGPRNVGGPPHTLFEQRAPSFNTVLPFSPAQPPPPVPLAPSPFQFPANGAVAGGSRPPQAGFFGVTPQGPQSYVPYQAQASPSHMPFGAPQPAPGGVSYLASVPPQPQLPVAGMPPMSQYQQQYPYVAAGAAPAQVPGHAQMPGYQPFPPASSQPARPGFYPTPATTPVPHAPRPTPTPVPPPSAISPPPPYLGGPPRLPPPPANSPPVAGSSAGYTAYNSPIGPQRPHPPVPQASPPPLPSIPPPPPPPILSAPPPPPPPPTTAAPPLPPTTSATSSKHGPKDQKSKSSTPVPAASPAGSSQPAKPGKVSIRSVATTSVAELYDYCHTNKIPQPQWCHEILKGNGAGEPKHKVWVVIGKTKFELPITFPSLSQGQERIAKKVLDQLRANPKAVKP